MRKNEGPRADTPGLFERLSYGSGDFGFNLYWTTVSAFLLIFYTDSFGLDPKVAGTMLLATKIVDAFADPLMGAIADRTRSRWGRFRPWLLWAAIPLAASGVLTFTTPHLDSQAKLVYAYATFALMMVIYSVINIPYGALSAVLTSDPRARTQINSFRFVGAFLGGTFVTYCTPKLVALLGQAGQQIMGPASAESSDVLGWQLTMALYGVIACALFVNLFRVTRERVLPINDVQVSPLRDIQDLGKNQPWMILFALALVVMVTISTRMGAAAYYMKYYVGRPDQTALFLTVYGVALAAGSLLTPPLARLFGRKPLMIALLILVGLLSIAFYFLPRNQLLAAYVLQALIGICLGPKSPLTFAMYADTADYTEYTTGRRATAMTFSAAIFAQKLGGAIASAVIGWVLATLGYVANQAQSGASLQGMVWLMSIVPGVLALIAAGIMVFYSLTDRKLADIQRELAERKSANFDQL